MYTPKFDLGGLADLTPTHLLGMSISNAKTLWYREVTTSIPMILKLGLSNHPITGLKLNGEVEQAQSPITYSNLA